MAFTSGASTTTLTATAYAAGANTLTMTESAKSGSASLTVSVAALDHFYLTPSTTTPTAGTSFTTNVAARDLYDNTVTSYTGAQTVAWSGLSTSPAPASRAPAYPSTSVTFTSGTAGPLSVTAYAGGGQTLTMTGSGKSGSASLTVTVAGARPLHAHAVDDDADRGHALHDETVAASDLRQHRDLLHRGPDRRLVGAVNQPRPRRTRPPSIRAPRSPSPPAPLAPCPSRAYTAGADALTMTGNGKSGSASLTVSAALQPSSCRRRLPARRAPSSARPSAADLYANTVTTYSGNKTLIWSGPGNAPIGTTPVYPTNPVNFSGGTATVNVTLYKAESPAITVSDGTLSGTSSTFTVNPATPDADALHDPARWRDGRHGVGHAAGCHLAGRLQQRRHQRRQQRDPRHRHQPRPRGTLSGTTTVGVSNGIATFSGLSIDKVAPGTR